MKSKHDIEKQIDPTKLNTRSLLLEKVALEDFYKTYQKIKKYENSQKEDEEYRRVVIMEAQDKRDQIRKNHLKELKDQEYKLKFSVREKLTRQNEQVQKIKHSCFEDIEEKKEFQMLRKIDQEENLKRTKNFFVR